MMRTELAPTGRAAAATIALACLACHDASRPMAPVDDRPALAANTSGPLAVKSTIGLEPLIGAIGNISDADDINDVGHVVGVSSSPSGHTHAVLWTPAASVFPLDLGTLPGGTISRAKAINADGTVIVGWSDTHTFDVHATRWVKVSDSWLAQDLGVLPGATHSQATDIADDGSIVGFTTGGGTTKGFLWQNGVMQDLEPHAFARAHAINNSLQIVGVNHFDAAIIWQYPQGPGHIFGTLGGTSISNIAEDVNAFGEAAGTALLTNNVTTRAFLWTVKKGMVDLGTLGGPSSAAYGIDDAGQIVGASGTAAFGDHAFIWAKGKILDLGVLPGYEQSLASAINNEKQIAGSSSGSAGMRATLWTIK